MAKEKSDVKNDPDGDRRIKAKRVVGIVSVLIFVALMVWVTVYIGKPLIRELFGSDGTDGRVFSQMVADKPVLSRLIFVGIQILQVFVALIPGEAVEIAAGLAFGAIEGLALALLGVAIGSTIIFLLTKTLGMKFVELFVSREKINSMKLLRDERRLNELVFLVFFIPGTPKDVLTYFVGLTKMKLPTFLLISLLARVPSVLSSTWGGSALMAGDYTKAIWIFGVTAAVSAVGLFIYNRVSGKKQQNAKKDEDK